MVEWSNWAGNQRCRPATMAFVRSVEELGAVVAAAADAGRRVRAAGAGHSHAGLVPTDDVIVDLSGLSGVIGVDGGAGVARVWAGTPISALGRPLGDAGVALANQGDIDRQSIGGAVATGTHGTGTTLASLTASVRAMGIVGADGELCELSGTQSAERFAAARLGLGAFGVVAWLDLAVRPAYRLAEQGWTEPYADVRDRVGGLVTAHRHAEFFWYPHRDRCIVKVIDETDEPAQYPLAPEGERVGWSHEVLPNHRPDLHTEMEFAVPLEGSLDCLDEIRSLLLERFADLRWPVEYRTLAADDVWLSQAYERPSATISVHQGIDQPADELFAACESVFRSHRGRPHWGKVHEHCGDELASAHPRWNDWWHQRDLADPAGIFCNDLLDSWRPG
jgi:FAD/FMN-containing dehydrogenase